MSRWLGRPVGGEIVSWEEDQKGGYIVIEYTLHLRTLFFTGEIKEVRMGNGLSASLINTFLFREDQSGYED